MKESKIVAMLTVKRRSGTSCILTNSQMLLPSRVQNLLMHVRTYAEVNESATPLDTHVAITIAHAYTAKPVSQEILSLGNFVAAS